MSPTRSGSLTLCCLAALTLGCGDDGGDDATGSASGTMTDSTTTAGTDGTTTAGTDGITTAGTDGTTAGTTSGTTEGETSGGTTGGTAACPYTENTDADPTLDVELVASGFDRPVLVVGHPTEAGRLFVVEQGGSVKLLDEGVSEAPADDYLTVEVTGANNQTIGDERGLLGFALHPNYPTDPRVYIAYSPANSGMSPSTVVAEYTEAGGTASFTRNIIAIDQPAGNHNGGMIAFGSDGYLYIGNGDGGGADDPFNTGRAPGTVLAKILRLDVEPDQQPDTCTGCDAAFGPFDYTIPADNPFVDDNRFTPEVWAWGFRNPWRFSFDPADGSTMYAADVGQDEREEVAIVEAGDDHGWSDMEGIECFDGANCDDNANPGEVNNDGLTLPIVDYGHASGRCSITGLGVYRSCEVAAYDGAYFYSDYCTGEVWAVIVDGNSITAGTEPLFDFQDERILGGGNNALGDVFVTTAFIPNGPNQPIQDGRVYRLTAE